jgi:hypothetical protein
MANPFYPFHRTKLKNKDNCMTSYKSRLEQDFDAYNLSF